MAVLLLPACVTRTFTITSDPPGAEVYLDGSRAGTTPFTETFLSYGVRRVELRKPGHLRTVEEVELERPWWQYFPISVVADLFWPFEVLDEHDFHATLRPRTAGGTSWQDAQQAYADFLAMKRRMDARELLFSGRDPALVDGDGNPLETGDEPATDEPATASGEPGDGGDANAGDDGAGGDGDDPTDGDSDAGEAAPGTAEPSGGDDARAGS